MSPARVFSDPDEFAAAVGQRLGTSSWHTVTQEQVNLFAEATGDHQWIHVDVERATAGPFGAPVAHGYGTVSLIPMFAAQIYRIDGLRMGINYGLDTVRFPRAVTVGSRIRATAELTRIEPASQGIRAVLTWTIEIEGETKPACVAETVSVLVPEQR